MSEGFYSTTQCQRMLLAYLVKNKEDLATYTMCLDTDVFTSKAREWIFLILKKNYLYSKSLTSKEMFYIEMEQQLDARQEKYGKEISEELDIIYSIEPSDSIDLIVRKLEEANVAAQLVNVMQTTHGYLSSGNVEEAIDAYKKASMQITLSEKKKQTSGLFKDCDSWLEDIRNRKYKPDQYAGLKTGFKKFDEMTGGLFPCELYLAFALPGRGKSTFLKNIVMHVINSGHNVLFVPNEENKRQVETKFISMMTNIPGFAFKNGKYTQEQYNLVDKFLHNKGERGQIYIHPINQGVDATVIERQFNQLKAKGIKIDLIVVDYLDLMGSPFKTYSEWDEQAKITNSLKQLSIDCNVPVFSCTQANIESEKQQKKDNPFLTQSDVYGSKSKNFTSNMLIGLVNKTAANDITADNASNPVHKMVMCVCKNRDGSNFASRISMYSKTGLMVQDDEQVSLSEAQAALAIQLEKVKQLDKQFKKDEEKEKLQRQLKQFKKEINEDMTEDEQFLEQDFDYLSDVPSVSDEEIQQRLKKQEEYLKSQEQIENEFLNQFDNSETVNDSSSSSEENDNELDDESFLDQLESVQANTFVEEQQQQEELFENNEVQQEEQPKQLSAYELFKMRNKK